MPDAPTPPPTPPVNAITIPIPSVSGDLMKHFVTIVITLGLAYLSAKLGVPVVPPPAAPAPTAPVVSQ